MELSIRVHWLAFTVHGLPLDGYKALWAELFEDRLGPLVEQEWGNGFYRLSAVSASGAVVYHHARIEGQNHIHVVLRGDACDSLLPDDFRAVYELMLGGLKVNITRFDVAVDGARFRPLDVYQAVKCYATGFDGFMQHCAAQVKREGVNGYSFHSSPTGDTANIGSRSSGRFLRVYNERGFTRVELECKSDWAMQVFALLMQSSYADWLRLFLGVLDQFVSFVGSWWAEFIGSAEMASIVISSVRNVSLARLEKWLKRQVVHAVLAVSVVHGGRDEFWDWLSENIDLDKLRRYTPILQLAR